MEKLNLKMNNKIEIIWNLEGYRSNIQDINDKSFAISIPTREGSYLPLEIGDEVEVIYYEALSVFKFKSLVVARKIDGIPVIILNIPKEYTVIQRRQYVRVDKVEYINVASMDNEIIKREDILTLSNDNTKCLKKAVLMDLSGGGMKVKMKEDVKEGDLLHFFLDTKKERLSIYGKVVRIEKDKYNYNICGICFFQLTLSEREKIIQYTFEIMRNQRSKSL